MLIACLVAFALGFGCEWLRLRRSKTKLHSLKSAEPEDE